jgi:uncharacterized membrane protein
MAKLVNRPLEEKEHGNSALLWQVSQYFPFLYFVIFLIKSPQYLLRSFWIDESSSYTALHDSILTTFIHNVREEYTSPLYFLILWVTTWLLGTAEFAMRTPSVIFVFCAAVALYFLAREFFKTDTCIFASVLFLLLPDVGAAMFNARPYALALFFAVFSLLAFVRWARTKATSWGILYVILTSCAIYAHPLYGLIVIIEFAFILLQCLQISRSKLILAGVAMLFLQLPWIIKFHYLISIQGKLKYTRAPLIENVVVFLMQYDRWLILYVCIALLLQFGSSRI